MLVPLCHQTQCLPRGYAYSPNALFPQPLLNFRERTAEFFIRIVFPVLARQCAKSMQGAGPPVSAARFNNSSRRPELAHFPITSGRRLMLIFFGQLVFDFQQVFFTLS